MVKNKLIFLFLVFGLASKHVFASLDESGLEIAAGADIVGEMGFQDSARQDTMQPQGFDVAREEESF